MTDASETTETTGLDEPAPHKMSQEDAARATDLMLELLDLDDKCQAQGHSLIAVLNKAAASFFGVQ